VTPAQCGAVGLLGSRSWSGQRPDAVRRGGAGAAAGAASTPIPHRRVSAEQRELDGGAEKCVVKGVQRSQRQRHGRGGEIAHRPRTAREEAAIPPLPSPPRSARAHRYTRRKSAPVCRAHESTRASTHRTHGCSGARGAPLHGAHRRTCMRGGALGSVEELAWALGGTRTRGPQWQRHAGRTGSAAHGRGARRRARGRALELWAHVARAHRH